MPRSSIVSTYLAFCLDMSATCEIYANACLCLVLPVILWKPIHYALWWWNGIDPELEIAALVAAFEDLAERGA